MNTGNIFNTKNAINVLIFIVVGSFTLYVLFFLLLFPKNHTLKVDSKTESSLIRFDINKSKLLPLLKKDTEMVATSSAARGTYTKEGVPESYEYGKAKVVYLPAPNIFEGRVDSAENIEEYRRSKKAIVEFLKKSGIDVCSLNVYWARPPSVEKTELTSEDLSTEGCMVTAK